MEADRGVEILIGIAGGEIPRITVKLQICGRHRSRELVLQG